jgi:ubiquinone/menaquinone biosynthesis C-methylase UbiE
LKNEVWRAVIRAIEAAIPDYDPVNEKVSLGRAQKTRVYAAERLKLGNGMLLLDAGIGPGTMTELLLQRTGGITVVGLDASSRLLSAAGDRLEGSYGDRLHLVRGAFEALPFRESSFQRIVSSYAFRDARDRTRAIDEFCRVAARDGLFGIVDLGKPNNSLKRSFIGFYVRYLIPLIAKFSMSKVTTGNPWQMIYPTYRALGNNGELVAALNGRFQDIRITEFALGGVIFVLAGKSRFIV